MAAKAEQPMAAPRRGEFRAQSEHVEKLAATLDQAGDPEVRAAALELVQSVVELHGAALQRLIETADVFIANVRLAALERLGLDAEALRGRYRRLIVCWRARVPFGWRSKARMWRRCESLT